MVHDDVRRVPEVHEPVGLGARDAGGVEGALVLRGAEGHAPAHHDLRGKKQSTVNFKPVRNYGTVVLITYLLSGLFSI